MDNGTRLATFHNPMRLKPGEFPCPNDELLAQSIDCQLYEQAEIVIKPAHHACVTTLYMVCICAAVAGMYPVRIPQSQKMWVEIAFPAGGESRVVLSEEHYLTIQPVPDE